MSSTPPEPPDKTSVNDTKKRKSKRSRYLRFVAYIVISVLCEAILVTAASTPLQKSPLLVIVLYSLVPTILLAIALFIVQTFDEHTETLGETDEKLLLLRLEEIELGIMSLDYHKDQIHFGIFKAFGDINWSLQRKVPNDYFKKITLQQTTTNNKT